MSINYKSKADIPYFKFLEFSNIIESKSEAFITSETQRIFNPNSIDEFSLALTTNAPYRPSFRLDLKFKKVWILPRLWHRLLRQPVNETAGNFIDADTYFTDKDYKEFFKLVIKRKYFFKKINFEKISLAEAEYIISKFEELKDDLKNSYEYLYNPPIRSVSKGITPRSIERDAFAEHYGSYIEMIYVLCKGDFTKFDEIIVWDLHRFLFQSEYLIRKRDIENLK